MIKRLRAAPADSVHLGLMLALTFVTGVIDAVGYLGLDRVFTANMTGNVAILGMAIVGADNLPVLGPLLALLGFLAGAALGGRVLRRAGPGWTHEVTVLFAFVALIEAVLGSLLLAGLDHEEHAIQATVTTILAVAMGAQAATARFIAVKDVTTVVVTSAITGLAADSVLGTGKGGGAVRRASAVVLILGGAAVGALLLPVHLGAGLLLAGAITGLVTVLGALVARRPERDLLLRDRLDPV